MPTTPYARRRLPVVVAAVLAALALPACSSEGAETSCGLDACTVTFDRGTEAKASLLGVEARLVKTEGDTVTVEVAGEQLTLTAGQAAADAGGLQVTLESVTDSNVVVRIARGGEN
jgi:hypothetical protein